jgi:uncharacterized protein
MKLSVPLPQQEVPSPCVGVCALDGSGVCTGCGRTIGEISEWPGAPARRRIDIRALAAARQASRRQGEQQ